jgi:hypothetical protein
MSSLILCLIHNPRTAGASTIKYLKDHKHFVAQFKGNANPRPLIPGSDVCGLGEQWKENFAAAIPQPIDQPYFLAGHMPYGINDYLLHDNFHYFTIVRDPLKRIWSRYNTFLHAVNYDIHKQWKNLYNLDIVRIMEAGEPELCNDQTRLISGSDKVHMEAEDLANALFNLDTNFSYATVTERVPHHLLDELHSFFPQVVPGKMNIRYNSIGYGAIGESPPKRVREACAEYNKHDQVLYDYVAKHGKVGVLCQGKR